MTADPMLVPELLVTHVARSIEFWCDLCGFEIDYQREAEGFAYISRGNAHVMLEQAGVGRNWITGPLDPPFGRGINFQVSVATLAPILDALRGNDYALFMEQEVKWHRVGDAEEAGVEQFLVADPDGYLIRFQALFGRRPAG
ncbi:MAG: bleomycin resistance protein [Microbacterium sp.]